MPGMPVELGPWSGGLKNSAGLGEFIEDNQVYGLENLEVDTDGSLVNRPAISRQVVFGLGGFGTDEMQLIGSYITPGGKKLLVATKADRLCLVEPATSQTVFTRIMVRPRAVVAFHGELFVVPQAAGQGGRVTNPSPTTFAWDPIASMPVGSTAVVYKTRMFIGEPTEARVHYSDPGNFSTWNPVNNFGVGWEDGLALSSLRVIGEDIIMFKSDSTYRYGYASDPANAEIKLLSSSVGSISEKTTVVYNNNTIYTLHGNVVWELYQNTFTRISDDLNMSKNLTLSLWASQTFALAIFNDRLFVRYYSNQYVLSLVTQRWSQWKTARIFSEIVSLPGTEPDDEIAYMAVAGSISQPNSVWFMTNNRLTNVGANPTSSDLIEQFDYKVITKTFDFQTPTYFKTILMGGLAIATSSPTTIQAVVPGTAFVNDPTWGQWFNESTWGGLYALGVTWGSTSSSDGDVITSSTVMPDSTPFGRKLLKCLGKFRYRQVQLVITGTCYSNGSASYSVRLFNMTVYALQKETVVKAVTA